jgi:trimeric autotransporter adhesin
VRPTTAIWVFSLFYLVLAGCSKGTTTSTTAGSLTSSTTSSTTTANTSGGSGTNSTANTNSGTGTNLTASTLTSAAANLTAITVLPANPSIPINTVQQLTATGSYSDGSIADLTSLVTWTCSSIAVATVSASGAVTGVSAGTASITAILNGVSGSDTVTVTAPSIVSISVSPIGLTLPIGITQQFVATAIYSDGSSQDLTSGVTWSSSSTVVATIDNTGLATLVASGTTAITASVGSLSDSTTLTVVGAHLISITVSPVTTTMAVGTEQQFTATGVFDDGSTQVLATVQWASTSQTVLNVSAAGLGTAVGVGTSAVTATSGSVTASASVTVTSATVVSLAVAPLNSTMPIGASKQFTATGTFSDNSTQDLTQVVLWKSSSSTVASISATGLVTSFMAGTTTIQASSGSMFASTTLTVSNVDLASITITPDNPTIDTGTSIKLTATGTYSDGSIAVLSSLSWKSSKPQIANVRGSGIIHGKKVGQVTISATAFGVAGTTTVTVGSGTLVSVVITPANPSVNAGATEQFAATGTFSNGTTQDITINAHWSSSVASVATIANAPSQAGFATTYAHGTTTIGANSGGTTASTTLSAN